MRARPQETRGHNARLPVRLQGRDRCVVHAVLARDSQRHRRGAVAQHRELPRQAHRGVAGCLGKHMEADRLGREQRHVPVHIGADAHSHRAAPHRVQVEAASARRMPLRRHARKDGQRAVDHGTLGRGAHARDAALCEKVNAHGALTGFHNVSAKRVAPELKVRGTQKVVAQHPLRRAAQHFHHTPTEKLDRELRQHLAPARVFEPALAHLATQRAPAPASEGHLLVAPRRKLKMHICVLAFEAEAVPVAALPQENHEENNKTVHAAGGLERRRRTVQCCGGKHKRVLKDWRRRVHIHEHVRARAWIVLRARRRRCHKHKLHRLERRHSQVRPVWRYPLFLRSGSFGGVAVFCIMASTILGTCGRGYHHAIHPYCRSTFAPCSGYGHSARDSCSTPSGAIYRRAMA